MSFSTQKLVNNFPIWTKIRRDPSSLGARLMSVFADYVDFRGVELSKIKTDSNILKNHLGLANVWKLSLSSDDQLTPILTTGGITTWNYPTTVTGEFSTGSKTLTRVEDIESLFWSVPDEIILQETTPIANFIIWQSTAPLVINTIDNSDRLLLVIENSTSYFKKTRFTNKEASGLHLAVIKGKDINGLDFQEYIPVEDDGLYWTKNIISEVTSVDTEGFNGDVTLFVNTPITATRMLTDYYHIGASELYEGPLKLALSSDTLQYYVQRIKRGANYRVEGDIVDNDELIWEQGLGDLAGTAVPNIVDIAINWDTARLYALDNTGSVYVYEHGQTPFTPLVDEDTLTLETYIEIQPLTHWAVLNQVMTMFTWFVKPQSPVVGVTIKRRDPDGIVEYLQSNLTWAAPVYEFAGKDPENRLPEETWTNLTFTNDFAKAGEWEFYCTTRTQKGTSITGTKVMVDVLTALGVFASGVVTPTGIYFGETGQLCITDANNVYKYNEHSHVYLANGPTQQLFFREDYDNVSVTL